MGEEGTRSACLCDTPVPWVFYWAPHMGVWGQALQTWQDSELAAALSFPLCPAVRTKVSVSGSTLHLPWAPRGGGRWPAEPGTAGSRSLRHTTLWPQPGNSLSETPTGLPHCPLQNPDSGAVPFSSGWRFALCSCGHALGDPGWAGRGRSFGRGALLLWGWPGPGARLPPAPPGTAGVS